MAKILEFRRPGTPRRTFRIEDFRVDAGYKGKLKSDVPPAPSGFHVALVTLIYAVSVAMGVWLFLKVMFIFFNGMSLVHTSGCLPGELCSAWR